MRVLVTGSAGFIGRFVAYHLHSHGFDVFANTRQQCDLRDARKLPGPFDAVVHAAAAAGSWNTREDIVRDNIAATGALIRASDEWRPKLFIFLSSVSIYGHIEVPVVTEDTPIIDPDDYGMSKGIGEAALRLSKNLPSLALRLPGVIGPIMRGRNWLPRTVEQLKSGKAVEATNLDAPFNNALHVDDLARFIERALGRKNVPQYDKAILAAAGSLSVREVIERLAHGLGVRAAIREIPSEKSPFTLCSQHAIEAWGYEPTEIGQMIDRYAKEMR